MKAIILAAAAAGGAPILQQEILRLSVGKGDDMPKFDAPMPFTRRTLLHRGAICAVLIFTTIRGRVFAADVVVAIDNFAFSPTPLMVATSTTVTWENRDDIPHAVYCAALNLHSQPLETKDTFRHRFDQTGTFDYICSIHPHMRGRIIVSG